MNSNQQKISTVTRNRGIKVMNRPIRLGLAVLGALSLAAVASPVSAVEFGSGDFSATLDTTISYGASWRVEERCEDCIGKAQYDPFIGIPGTPLETQIAAPGRWSVNSDDGNLNYDDGDLVSHAVKLTAELDMQYRNFGGFFRLSAFHDFENHDKAALEPLTGRFQDARDFVGERVRLLDAFFYWDFDIGENPASIRFGRQVVSWGESTFIQGGINVINPVDVSKLRVAGAELKEAFLPIDMIHSSFSVTENLSFEALYMFEFEQIDPDPTGTYFGTNDFAVPAGEFVMLGFGLAPELTPGATIRRAADRSPDDSGQWGLAMRYYAPWLNDTEFGFYYLNYHSRLPLISGTAVVTTNPESGAYFVEYPEDIEMFGMSFNTEIAGIAFQGEISYRDKLPLQIDDVEVLFAALSPLNPLVEAPANLFASQLGNFNVGDEIRGWQEHEVTLAQMTVTKLFGPMMGADQVVLLGEIGAQKVWDLPGKDVLRYQGPGTDTGGGANALEGGNLRNPVRSGGFADDFSWGYRLVTRFDYNSAFGSPFNLFPRLAFNHDVSGTSAGPGGPFVDDRKSMTVGLAGTYLEKWGADLAYTRFSGGGQYNLLRDRDFVAFNIKYSF